MSGTEWTVARVTSITDGDTIRVQRSRTVEIDGRHYQLTDADYRTGVSIRLVWLDTPERGDHPGWERARDDLKAWISQHWPDYERPLRVICYESAGWDRLLGDLIDADGNSASQWMMTERNWPPYVAK